MREGLVICVFTVMRSIFLVINALVKIYTLELVMDESSDEAQEGAEQEGEVFEETTEPQPLISLQAIQGMSSFQTMKVTGHVGLQPIHILIDSGSTHNFLDITTAKKLRCELLKIPPIKVAVSVCMQEIQLHFIRHSAYHRHIYSALGVL